MPLTHDARLESYAIIASIKRPSKFNFGTEAQPAQSFVDAAAVWENSKTLLMNILQDERGGRSRECNVE